MRKGHHRQSKQCRRHLFSLRPIKDNIINPLNLKATFCQQQPPSNNEQVEHPTNCKGLNCPVFNPDRREGASTFVSRAQEMRHRMNPNILEMHHQTAMSSSLQKSLMFFPKPKSKHQYCYVCSKHYQDYRTHILQVDHRTEIMNSPFNIHILKLAKRFQKKTNKQKQSSRKKLKMAKGTRSCSEEPEPLKSSQRMKEDACTHAQTISFTANNLIHGQQSSFHHNQTLEGQMWQSWTQILDNRMQIYSNLPVLWTVPVPQVKPSLTYIIIDE